MKQYRTAFLLLFISLCAKAQKTESLVLDPSGFETEGKIALPFSGVKIIDARFDRTNIGCLHLKVSTNSVTYARVATKFPDSFHLFLPRLINNLATYSSDNNDTLVVLFKQFRIVEHLLNGVNQQYEPQLLVKVSASFFRQKNDSLVRISSFEDLISTKWPRGRKLKKEVVLEYRNEAFMKSLLALLDRKNWQDNGIAFAMQSVQEGLHKRFQLPLFTDNVLKPGIYKTFKEFKNNNPSIQGIKVRMNKNLPVEVTDGAGKGVDLKDCWGICIDNKRFIYFREKFFELQPSDRSFQFLSYTQTDDLFGQPSFGDYAPQTGILGALLIKAFDNGVSRQYFYLNMDEEDIYLEEIFGKSSLKAIQKELLK